MRDQLFLVAVDQSAQRMLRTGHLRRIAPTTDGRVTLDWASARPLLRRIFEAYEDAGAPERGAHAPPLVEASDHPASAAVGVDATLGPVEAP